MRIYAVRVAILGSDRPRVFYFKNKKKAKACYSAYERTDNIGFFDADDDFPLDMLSDEAF